MIRSANLDDVPQLVGMLDRMRAESPRFRRLGFDPEKTAGVVRTLIERPSGFAWVVQTDAGVVGMLLGMAVPHWSSDDVIASDLALYVAPEARGRPGASPAQLVQQYTTWAREQGAIMITAGVSTGFDKVVRLYEALGFTRCGTLLEV